MPFFHRGNANPFSSLPTPTAMQKGLGPFLLCEFCWNFDCSWADGWSRSSAKQAKCIFGQGATLCGPVAPCRPHPNGTLRVGLGTLRVGLGHWPPTRVKVRVLHPAGGVLGHWPPTQAAVRVLHPGLWGGLGHWPPMHPG